MSKTSGDEMTTAKNLRLLAAHLEDKEVRMRYFFVNVKQGSMQPVYDGAVYKLVAGEVERTEHWCGTAACAMGWATTHPEMPVLPEHFNYHGQFIASWYGDTYFPSPGVWPRVFYAVLPNEGAAQRCIDYAEILESYHE